MERKHPANVFVRECISQALFQLMEKQDFRKITVSSLVKTAGVSRNSFYRNYQSIEDILRQYLVDKTSQWWAEYLAHPHPNVIEETFQHFLSMKEELLLLYRCGLPHLLMEHIFACGRQSLTGDPDDAYRTSFLSGGLCGLTNQWVLREVKGSPQEMQALFFTQGQHNPLN